MQADRQNSGVLEGHDQRVISAQEERTWSVLSHLSMFLNLFTGFLEAVMNSISNGLGMRKTGTSRKPSRPWNPHFYTIFTQVHNTL